jgi:hypothetical protein
VAHSKTFKTDRFSGCSMAPDKDPTLSAAIDAQALADRAEGLYNPYFNRSEAMTGDDKALYGYAWKQALGTVTVKEGIAARREKYGY